MPASGDFEINPGKKKGIFNTQEWSQKVRSVIQWPVLTLNLLTGVLWIEV